MNRGGKFCSKKQWEHPHDESNKFVTFHQSNGGFIIREDNNRFDEIRCILATCEEMLIGNDLMAGRVEGYNLGICRIGGYFCLYVAGPVNGNSIQCSYVVLHQ